MKDSIKKFALTAGVVGTLAIAGVAFADAPNVTITGITGADVVSYVGSNLSVNQIPTTVSVNGTVFHDPNLNPVQNVNLYVNGVLTSTQAIANNIGDTYNFALPWTISAAQGYTLTVTAKHGNCPNDPTGCTGMDEVTLTVINVGGGGGGGGGGITVCPAAPAIGAAYMKAHNVKGGSPTWKADINYLAQNSGNGGVFWAKYACGGGVYADQAAFQHAVEVWVSAHI